MRETFALRRDSLASRQRGFLRLGCSFYSASLSPVMHGSGRTKRSPLPGNGFPSDEPCAEPLSPCSRIIRCSARPRDARITLAAVVRETRMIALDESIYG